MAIPDVAAVPARPMKWEVPALEAKREAPVWESKGSSMSELLVQGQEIISQMSTHTELYNFSKGIIPWP